MSTRATYKIKHAGGESVFYIHHDNYECGAAHYFRLMHDTKTKRNDLATRFVVGNNGHVEFTKSHEYHGDTEYRYTLEADGQLLAEKLVYDPNEVWLPIYCGHYAGFINRHIQKAYGDTYRKEKHHLVEITTNTTPWAECKRTEWLTIDEMRDRAVEQYRRALSFKDGNPNKDNALKAARELDATIQLLGA